MPALIRGRSVLAVPRGDGIAAVVILLVVAVVFLFLQNVRAMPNTSFNEAGWLYPSAASTSRPLTGAISSLSLYMEAGMSLM